MLHAVVALWVAVNPVPPVTTPVDCSSDPMTDCLDTFSNAAKETFGQQSNPQKAQTVGDAVKECLDCAGTYVKEKIESFDTEQPPK